MNITLWFLSLALRENVLNIHGIILKINGNIKDIPKAINAFSKTNTWVFVYIVKNDDKVIKKNKWNKIPII